MNRSKAVLSLILASAAAAMAQMPIGEEKGDATVTNGPARVFLPVPPDLLDPKPLPPINDFEVLPGKPIKVYREIRGVEGGAVADFGPTTVHWPAEISSDEAIKLVARDGKEIVFRPAFLVLSDRTTGESHLLAELTNTVGEIVSASEVRYPAAFNSDTVTADLRYEYDWYHDKFEQFIVLRNNFVLPEGLEAKNLRLECWTEWLSEDPAQVRRSELDLRAGAAGERAIVAENIELNFGAIKVVGQGKAFSIGAEEDSVPVGKSWVTVPVEAKGLNEGPASRRFLIEAVDYFTAKPRLDKLGKPKNQAAVSPAILRQTLMAALATKPGTKSLDSRGLESGMRRKLVAALASTNSGFVIDFSCQGSGVLPHAVVSWWEGVSGTDSIGSNHGTLTNVSSAQAYVGQGWVFTNVLGAVTVPDTDTLDVPAGANFTIEAWVYLPPPIYTVQTIVDKRLTTSDSYALGYAFYLNSRRLGVQLGGTTQIPYPVETTTTLAVGQWSHVAVTVNRSMADGVKLYINGELQASGNPFNALGDYSNDRPFLIGKHAKVGGYPGGFNGTIDELTFYRRALLPAEIKQVYLAGQAGKSGSACPTCSGCVTNMLGSLAAWWPGDNSTENRTGGNPVSLQNGATYTSSVVGQGFLFNGGQAHAFAPASSALNVGVGPGFSFEAWITPLSTNAGPIFEWAPSTWGSSGVHLWANYEYVGGVYAALIPTSGTGSGIGSSSILSLNDATHLVLTYDRNLGVAALYANGCRIKNDQVGQMELRTTDNFYLGYRPTGSASVNAIIDEPSIYNRALGSNEVAQLYAAKAAGKCSGTAPTVSNPASQILTVGQGLNLSVSSSGTPTPVYQWYKSPMIALNCQTPNYSIASVQAADSGLYYIVATNVNGSAQSAAASVAIVTTQPQGTTVNQGANATFTIAVQSPVTATYLWRDNGGYVIAGVTSATYTRTNIQASDAGTYSVTVTVAETARTFNANLSVSVQAPTISQQPDSTTVLQGKTATFTVSALGANLIYTWYRGTTLVQEGSSAILQILDVQWGHEGNYCVKVRNSGGEVTSSTVTLTVKSDTDRDGMWDDWEMQNWGSLERTGLEDYDGDGNNNETEYGLQTNPFVQDAKLQVFTPRN